MNLRRLLIRVMLWSLGIGAAVGATAVFFANSSTVWRIVGTCFVTALAAVLVLAASILSEKKDARGAGLFGMVLVLFEYFGALLLIWGVPWSTGWEFEGRLAITMSLAAPIGIAAMVLMRARFIPTMRLAGQIGVVLCVVQMLLVLFAVWTSGPGRSEQRYATAGVFALYSTFAVASLIGRSFIRWLGVLAAAGTLLVSLVLIWRGIRDADDSYTVVVTISAFFAYLNVMIALPLPARFNWLRFATIAAAALTAVCVDLTIIGKANTADWSQRVGAATGILGGCGTLAIAVLLRMNRPIDAGPEVLAEIKTLSLICPLCRKKQTVALGDSSCGGCGLIFHLAAEPPRCPSCGYVLLMNKSDRCPECGTTVANSTRS